MNEILAVVAFLVLVGLLASRMVRDEREYKLHYDSPGETDSLTLPEVVIPTTPQLPAQSPGSKR